MAYKVALNPFSGELQLVNGSSSGSGNVTGVPPTTVTAIARWQDTTGTTIENSLALVQDGGAVEAQGFISMRNVTATVTVNSGESWIAPSLILQPGSLVVLNPDSELIIL